jgi:serine protease Do
MHASLPSPTKLALLALALFAAAAGADTCATRRTPIIQAVDKTRSAVVAIKVAPPGGGKDHVGSGVIIDERGYIVSNRHVVGNCKTPRVQLPGGEVLQAEVLFAEARWDLAVLRIHTDRALHALPLAPSDDLMVGEQVIAVGHPYGYHNTVSVGIISALGREITMPTGDVLGDLIQTDASINPGNSGGPLLNVNGELIGITCALRLEARGIAFAISAATVKHALGTMLSARRVAGVHHGLACAEKTVSETGDRQRVLIAKSRDRKLRQGDEIVTMAERPVRCAFDVERSLWEARPGETIELRVRRDGRLVVVPLTLAASPGTEWVTHADAGDATCRGEDEEIEEANQ